jgi:hypothetical protein
MKRRDFLMLAGALPISQAFASTKQFTTKRDKSDGSDYQQKISLVSLLARSIDPSLALQVHAALRQDAEAALGAFLRYEFTWQHAIAFAFDRSPNMLPVLAGDVNEAYMYGRMLSPANIAAMRANASNRIDQAERLGAPRYGAAFSGGGNFERIARKKGLASLFQMWLITASAKFADNLFSDLADRVSGTPFDTIEDASTTVAQQLSSLNHSYMNRLFSENFLLPAGGLGYYGFQKAEPNSLLITGFSAGINTPDRIENSTLQFENGWGLTTNLTAFSPSAGVIGGAERFVTISSGEKRSRSREGIQYVK